MLKRRLRHKNLTKKYKKRHKPQKYRKKKVLKWHYAAKNKKKST